MIIVADENIPFAREIFGNLGEVRLMPGRNVDREILHDAAVLVVRSVTAVNEKLLRDSPVRFVGTATIGTDHVDLSCLRQAGIVFADAAGSNANSVVEYVVAALLHLAVKNGFELEGRTIGVIGAGNVGSRVAIKARALGMRVLLNDPPLERRIDELGTISPSLPISRYSVTPEFLSLESALQADFITLHTPLTRTGLDPTFHLLDARRFEQIKRGAILLNTSRGAVVHQRALRQALESGRIAAAVLDVWENEPEIEVGMIERVALGTPHIAGYSLDGKLQGTVQIYQALARFLGRKASENFSSFLPPPVKAVFQITSGPKRIEEILHHAVSEAYDIGADDETFREAVSQSALSPAERGRKFDKLRKVYPVRREFGNYTVVYGEAAKREAGKLEGLGFKIEMAT